MRGDGLAPTIFGNVEEELSNWLSSGKFSSVHVLCDSNTLEMCYNGRVGRMLRSRVSSPISFPAGEEFKTLETCTHVWRALIEQGADRHSVLINLGGGVVTDLGGFCAASFMRGMPFIHVPTSVLGMTDAAVGGKTGVDFDSFKNYVGVFAQPRCVIIDTGFIETLDLRQRRNGLAEILKHGFIHDPGLLDEIDNFAGVDKIDWDQIMARSVQTKLDVIAGDIQDRGIRAALNFGHTVGHAIESYSMHTDKPLQHGEAIALGMLVESRLSAGQAGLSIDALQRVEESVYRFFGDVAFPRISVRDLQQFIQKDKKKSGSDVLYSLISALGEPAVGQIVPETALNEAYLHYAKR